jgi:hypothetical protein
MPTGKEESMNHGSIEQGKFMGPGCHAMNHDMTRMGTQVSNSPITVLYTDRELLAGEMIIVNTRTGITVKVKLPPPTWAQLTALYEIGLYYDAHRYAPYTEKVNEMGPCAVCGKGELGYIGLKRVRYHWKDMPSEMHFGLCPECDSVFFVEVKK